MNKIYSKVWNKELGQLVVASEFAKSDSTGSVTGAAGAGKFKPAVLGAAVLLALGLGGVMPSAIAMQGGDGGNRNGHPGSTTISPSDSECKGGTVGAGGQATAFGSKAIAIGCGSQADFQSVSMGIGAGRWTNSGARQTHNNAVNIGYEAGQNVVGDRNVALGGGAGSNVRGEANLAFGRFAGRDVDGFGNVSIGEYATHGYKGVGSGQLNVAIGQFAATSGFGNSVAIGHRAWANGGSTVAIGNSSDAAGTGTIALGFRAGAGQNQTRTHETDFSNPNIALQGTADHTAGGYNMFIGAESGQKSSGSNLVAVGREAGNALDGTDNVALGRRANSFGHYTDDEGNNWVDFGNRAGQNRTADNTTAIGTLTLANQDQATAVGYQAQATAENALAVGFGSTATAKDATALGREAAASIEGSVALGQGSTTSAAVATSKATVDKVSRNFAGAAPASVVSVGSAGSERQVHHVAAGRLNADSTDAVTEI